MNVLRKNLLKNIFGVALLFMMLLKVCAFYVSHFSPSANSFAVEKNVEEGKDAKEEALDKNEKKLLTCVFFSIDQGHLIWVSRLPLSIYSYKMQIGSHPLKTVPTPPPDLLG